MKTYTVSFFGHRKISKINLIEEQIEKIVKFIIDANEYSEFLVGNNGEFDMIVSSEIKRILKENNYHNSSLVIILPYITSDYIKNEHYFIDFFDEIEICEESSNAYFKAAITIRNRNMIDRSDLVIFYSERNSGGTYQALRYAKQKNIKLINIFDSESSFLDIPIWKVI